MATANLIDISKGQLASNSPCQRPTSHSAFVTSLMRVITAFNDEGYINGYTAELNPKKVNLNVIAFAQVSMDNHHPETLKPFLTVVDICSKIQECHSVSGDCDFLLKIITKDLVSYDELLSKQLLQARGVRSVNTMFSMKQPKITRAFPLSEFSFSDHS